MVRCALYRALPQNHVLCRLSDGAHDAAAERETPE